MARSMSCGGLPGTRVCTAVHPTSALGSRLMSLLPICWQVSALNSGSGRMSHYQADGCLYPEDDFVRGAVAFALKIRSRRLVFIIRVGTASLGCGDT